MTNAELAKQIKEFAEKLDRYYANQEETINKYDDKIVHLHNELEELAERVNGLGIAAQETTRQLKEQTDRLNRYRDVQDKQFATYDSKIKQQSTSIGDLEAKSIKAQAVFDKLTEAYSNLNGRLGDYKSQLNDKLESVKQRLDSMDDTTAYVRQVAEESKKIEEALKVSTRKLDLYSQKNLELMEKNKRLSEQNVKLQEEIKAANKMCDNASKKASRLADRVEKLEGNSSRILRLEDRVWEHEDKLVKASKPDDRIQQLETALMQLRLNISSISSVYGIPEESKTIESMYPCLWACEHSGKECNGQAQVCPIAEHFSNLLENGIWRYSDGVKLTEEEIRYMENVEKEVTSAAGIKPLWTDNAVEKMTRPILFQKFNAGKMAIVFDGNDPHFEATYLDFWREFDEWCRTSEKDDRLYPQSSWVTRGYRMNPLMKCPSIYKDHASFAIWTEWVEEKDEPTFEYGTLMTDWREHKTVGGLPYTVWKI